MATHSVAKLNEDLCPIPEQLFGQLHNAAPPDAVEVAGRAVFCYNKSHLRALGLMIASTCDRKSLVKAAGRSLGVTIHCQSKDPNKTLSAERMPTNTHPPKLISLAHNKHPDHQFETD